MEKLNCLERNNAINYCVQTFHLRSPTTVFMGFSSVVKLQLHLPVHRSKYSYFRDVLDLPRSTHLLAITCLRELCTPRALCGMSHLLQTVIIQWMLD